MWYLHTVIVASSLWKWSSCFAPGALQFWIRIRVRAVSVAFSIQVCIEQLGWWADVFAWASLEAKSLTHVISLIWRVMHEWCFCQHYMNVCLRQRRKLLSRQLQWHIEWNVEQERGWMSSKINWEREGEGEERRTCCSALPQSFSLLYDLTLRGGASWHPSQTLWHTHKRGLDTGTDCQSVLSLDTEEQLILEVVQLLLLLHCARVKSERQEQKEELKNKQRK